MNNATTRRFIVLLNEEGLNIAVITDGVPRFMSQATAETIVAKFEARYPGNKYAILSA